MKRALCAGALVLVVLTAACGQREPAGYPPEFELNFMRACEAQNPAADICRCTWERIEANIAAEDFVALERLSPAQRARSPINAQIEGYALGCAAEAASANAPAGEQAP